MAKLVWRNCAHWRRERGIVMGGIAATEVLKVCFDLRIMVYVANTKIHQKVCGILDVESIAASESAKQKPFHCAAMIARTITQYLHQVTKIDATPSVKNCVTKTLNNSP